MTQAMVGAEGYDEIYAPKAKIILDSISPDGVRLTTWEVMFHRFVLAEFNTHRNFSRSSASSRAIPVEKQIAKVSEHPAWPISWPAEQAGMQGGAELEGADLDDAQDLFRAVRDQTLLAIYAYLDHHPDKSTRLHKSLINRLLEPFMWHTVIVATTQFRNFFDLRVSEQPMPEIRIAATCMLEALQMSDPVRREHGQWHRPYILPEDQAWATDAFVHELDRRDALNAVSSARCARVSYLTHDTGTRDPDKDLELYAKLVTADPPHSAPLEMVATPVNINAPGTSVMAGMYGNLRGWVQWRHIIEERMHKGAIFGPPGGHHGLKLP